jgi:solute carrier family 35 protein C2
VIKETSALTFMVAGTCKEVLTVLAAVAVFGDKFGLINGVGLIVVILGVVLFNCYKLHKLRMESAEAIRSGGPRPSKDGCLGTAEGSLVYDMSPRCPSANRQREGAKSHSSQLSRTGNGVQIRHSGTFGEFMEDEHEDGGPGDLENAPLLRGASSTLSAAIAVKSSKK